MNDTMESKEVTNENHLGSLVLLMFWKIDLRDLNPSSIYVFMFVGFGSGFGVPSCGCIEFLFSPSPVLIIVLHFNKGIYINSVDF